MKRWLGLFAVLGVMVAAALLVSSHLRRKPPEDPSRLFSKRCGQVKVGMTHDEVDVLFGLDPKKRSGWGSFIGPGPYICTATYRPSDPKDTRYLEVIFRDDVGVTSTSRRKR